jgi:transcriptional regulator with XRE-family HTH domain
MNISENIYNFRKSSGLTQENLADKLGISFQAVSKWETGQSMPDITALPVLADIFGTSIDGLFGRDGGNSGKAADVPWEDDGKLRGMVFIGRTLLEDCDLSQFTFTYEGEALNVESNCNINCGDVEGNVNAGVDVHCGDIGGNVEAGVSANCGDVSGSINAGVSVNCGDIGGGAQAGVSVNCNCCK